MRHHEEHLSKNMAQQAGDDINGRLVAGLRDVSHTLRSLYEGRGSQKRVLAVLSETGPITQRELTRRLGIQPGSASEVIAKLEHAGLVERTASEEDRRTADVSLTEAGARQAEHVLEQRQQRHEEMFSALTGEEKEQLLVLLDKVGADWQQRYGEQRERHHGHHHGGDFERHADEGGQGHHRRADGEDRPDHGQEERRHCDHDCANCPNPCGRGRNRQG